jgi:hypothetical protein
MTSGHQAKVIKKKVGPFDKAKVTKKMVVPYDKAKVIKKKVGLTDGDGRLLWNVDGYFFQALHSKL